MISLFFVDRNPRVIDAIRNKFEGRKSPQVEFHFVCNDIFSVQGVDAYVTAGNSYGIMSGGIDLTFRNIFGIQLQDTIQEKIFFNGLGKLPVGETISIKVKFNNSATHIIYAPIMEKPQNISDTENVRLAFEGILNKSYSLEQNEFKPNFVVACPGLGCLIGQMPLDKMTDQLLSAWEYWQQDVLKNNTNETISKLNV